MTAHGWENSLEKSDPNKPTLTISIYFRSDRNLYINERLFRGAKNKVRVTHLSESSRAVAKILTNPKQKACKERALRVAGPAEQQ